MIATMFAPARSAARPTVGLSGLFRRVAAWREVARQRRALADLPPEMLRDIGLDAEAVSREADRAFWDAPARLR